MPNLAANELLNLYDAAGRVEILDVGGGRRVDCARRPIYNSVDAQRGQT